MSSRQTESTRLLSPTADIGQDSRARPFTPLVVGGPSINTAENEEESMSSSSLLSSTKSTRSFSRSRKLDDNNEYQLDIDQGEPGTTYAFLKIKYVLFFL